MFDLATMSLQAIGYTFGPALPAEPFGPQTYKLGSALKNEPFLPVDPATGLENQTEALTDWDECDIAFDEHGRAYCR